MTERATAQRQATAAKIERVFMAALKTVGFRKVTVKMLVADAHINRGTFYLHFLDKYDLLDQIETDLFDQIRALVQAGLAQTPPVGQTSQRQLVRVVIQFIYDHFGTFKLLSSDRGDPKFMQKYVQAITPLVFQETTAGLARPDYALAAIAGMLTGLFSHWLEQEPPLTPTAYLESVAQVAQRLPELLTRFYD